MTGRKLPGRTITTPVKVLAFLILFPSAVFPFCFERAAQEYEIPRPLIETIAETESAMNPRALNQNANGSFDMGLMQINSYWVGVMDLQKERLIDDPCYNVMTGARILRRCIDRYGYNWEAVGCYNATSLEKKVSYSWKVYRVLANKPREPALQSPAARPAASSLRFEVRDVTEQGPVKP